MPQSPETAGAESHSRPRTEQPVDGSHPADVGQSASKAQSLLAEVVLKSLYRLPGAVNASIVDGAGNLTDDAVVRQMHSENATKTMTVSQKGILKDLHLMLDRQPSHSLNLPSVVDLLGNGDIESGRQKLAIDLAQDVRRDKTLDQVLREVLNYNKTPENGSLEISSMSDRVNNPSSRESPAVQQAFSTLVANAEEISHDGKTISRSDAKAYEDRISESVSILGGVPKDPDNLNDQMFAFNVNLQLTSEPELQVFNKQSMQEFDQRVGTGEISAADATQVYRAANQLLTEISPYLSDDERGLVAGQILHHAAVGRADQGPHPTCGVTAIENMAFDVNPGLAANMIASAALTGAWTGRDGKKIAIDRSNMIQPYSEQEFPVPDGARTLASQIFQSVALNDIGQHLSRPLRFLMDPIRKEDYWSGSNIKPTRMAGLPLSAVSNETHRLFGDKFEVLKYDSAYSQYLHPFSALSVPASVNFFNEPNKQDSTFHYQAKEELVSKLENLKKENRLPAIMDINDENPDVEKASPAEQFLAQMDFLSTSPSDIFKNFAKQSLGIPDHVIMIKDYDPVKKQVYISNSHGEQHDGWISLDTLWSGV